MTAEEILESIADIWTKGEAHDYKCCYFSDAVEAMQTYANQETARLRADNAVLVMENARLEQEVGGLIETLTGKA